MSTLAQERERARRLATVVVSWAIGVMGVTLAAFAVALTVLGGAGFLFLTLILFAFGALLALLGFFFQLVPLKLQELAEGKRETDRLRREEREARARGEADEPR